MGIKSSKDVYQLVEKHLRKADKPMTCVHLMDILEVRNAALNEYGGKAKDVRLATNKLSDALGFMWRRGLLTRYPASKESTSLARYAYVWEQRAKEEPAKPIPPPVSISKHNMQIIEHAEGVEIVLDKFSLFIKPR